MKNPPEDPMVAGVRAIRDKHASAHGYELKAIFRDLRAQQAMSGHQYVRYPARPAADARLEKPRT